MSLLFSNNTHACTPYAAVYTPRTAVGRSVEFEGRTAGSAANQLGVYQLHGGFGLTVLNRLTRHVFGGKLS